MTGSRWTGYHWACVGFCLFAFVGAGLIADLVFERVPHIEDEIAYLFQAQVFASGQFYVDAPFRTNCFFAPFVLDHQGRRFGKYPPGWPALLAAGLVMGQAWWVNAACAALTLALVFRLGSEMHHPVVGALAAGLGCISPFVLLLSGSLMSHSACLLFATAFLWCFWRGREHAASARDSWSWAAGGCWGQRLPFAPLQRLPSRSRRGFGRCGMPFSAVRTQSQTTGRLGGGYGLWHLGLFPWP